MPDNIFVTRPSMPPLEEFDPYLKKIWESKWLTNNGSFHQELEKKLCEFLDVPHISLFVNGTIALMTAIKALGISGEVITTPYSFVATSNVLLWQGIKPVFVDIEKGSFNIDPECVESAITAETTAIMPVHVYGTPCNTKKLDNIASRYNIKIIYDAAHAFGVKVNGTSVLNMGDLSVLSFHATKIFNTFEGGAIICQNQETKNRIDKLKNFGFENETMVTSVGINGKMNEFQAAMGLLQLKYIDQMVDERRFIFQMYHNELCNIRGITLYMPPDHVYYNYAYFPILINEEICGPRREAIYETLKNNGINSRRYFYPLICEFPIYSNNPTADFIRVPNAYRTSREILCLPIYPGLEAKTVQIIARLIKNSIV